MGKYICISGYILIFRNTRNKQENLKASKKKKKDQTQKLKQARTSQKQWELEKNSEVKIQ